jgi:toxin ParE1/3/4
MGRLTISESVRSDLRALREHIAKDNPEAARRLIERLREKARALADTPGMGRSRGEDLRPGLFSFPVGRYVLFYSKQPGGIVLVRVLHVRRDVPAIF